MLARTITQDDAAPRVWLDDRYELHELIGAGRTSLVYRAVHLALQRVVAIKILRTERATDPVALERFRLAGIAGARLDHPNSVRCMDGGMTADHRPFLVLELVQGQTLTQLLRAPAALPPPRSVRLMTQLLSVLAAAAAQGITHGDLDSDHVMVETGRDGADRVRLLDLGRAQIVGDLDRLPARRSPSVVVPAATDVHALGVLCLLLASATPFPPRHAVRRAPGLRGRAGRTHRVRSAA